MKARSISMSLYDHDTILFTVIFTDESIKQFKVLIKDLNYATLCLLARDYSGVNIDAA